MEVKECRRIAEDARAKLDNVGEVGAFIYRLEKELDTGFCEDRICQECPVYAVRNGIRDIDLSVREMVVSVVSGALETRLASHQVA